MTSSPLRPGVSLEEELDYYKKQYEQLETDLADFQASSKELEEQLERDIENAEKSERKLKEQVEKLTFEVDEWKTKHKQAKAEANSAHNALQKEITTMRETNRAMQLRLRDIEVVNDDYERQARNTESSLEDLESKYNVAIERGVLLDEELRNGEKEREGLRIETQRLRDELSELKVENEITFEKLRLADETIERLRSRKPTPPAIESLRARSPGSEASGITPYSPTASTPPPKSDTASEAATPPSPPLSDAPANAKHDSRTPLVAKRRSLIPDNRVTPRPALSGPRAQLMHSRGPSATSSNGTTSEVKAMRPPPSSARPRPISRPSNLGSEGTPRSDSLYQIRSLRGRMQKIEERVHSARSKLPAPKVSTPKGSPRPASGVGDDLPASVTVRRKVKRPSSSNFEPQVDGTSDATSETPSRRQSYVKRQSLGIPRPTSTASDRPASAFDRPPSATGIGRPSSRLSLASVSETTPAPRPTSRTGAQTPITASRNGPNAPTAAAYERSNSRAGGTLATVNGTPRTHRPSASVSELRRLAKETEDRTGPTSPTRSTAFNKSVSGGMPPAMNGKRPSLGFQPIRTLQKRASVGQWTGTKDDERPGSASVATSTAPATAASVAMPPPRRKMSDVGETY